MNGTLNVYDLAEGSLARAVFLHWALGRALRFRAFDTWRTDRASFQDLIENVGGDVVHAAHWDGYEGVVVDLPSAVVCAQLELKPKALPQVKVDVLADTRQAATLQMARMKELMAPAEDSPGDEIMVSFWYSGAHGATKVQRTLDAPTWMASGANYPPATRRALEPLMADVARVTAGGRLLLWYGPPGTGKTSALRALARENHARVHVEYVIDPEAMFGRNSGYFVGVLFDEDGAEEDERDGVLRMLVLEDCDELLAADAKERSGQGLARLLNLVDGLIGQGLNVAVLITTNEPIGNFHPAVSRPGRCGAVVAFELFAAEEAAAWLAERGAPNAPAVRASLADLFAVRDGREAPAAKPPIGFETPRPVEEAPAAARPVNGAASSINRG